MTLLSRKADYALLILSHLYSNQEVGGTLQGELACDHDPEPGRVSHSERAHVSTARAIADRFGLSRAFVANILKELCQSGYVASSRGVKGGYSLLRPASQITIAELLESIDEGFKLTLCNGQHSQHEDACNVEHHCPMKGPIAQIHQRLVDVLRSVTLAELFEPRRSCSVERMLPLLTLPASVVCSSVQSQEPEPEAYQV